MLPVNKATCDDCGKPVERNRIERSANANNGIPIGPWQCQSCANENEAAFQLALIAHNHATAVQNNHFDTLCNEVDPRLAEAIRRAGSA
jgi:hypothetical protein